MLTTIWPPCASRLADFSLEQDFTRWRRVNGARPLYIQKVNFELGGRFREKRIQDPKEREHQAPPPNVRLPLMPRATKFLWSNMMTDPIRCTSQTKRFLSTFPAVPELEFQGTFPSTVGVKQFLSISSPSQRLPLIKMLPRTRTLSRET
ncbi:hypothetical protein F5146DRAFT_1129580 [Armillaria mellea]|nr:hypothetical protein F5146DRAFT_1129580 [Armillaria mellea]